MPFISNKCLLYEKYGRGKMEKVSNNVKFCTFVNILRTYSNEDVSLSTKEINYHMKERLGLTLDRRTIYSYIKDMRHMGLEVSDYNKEKEGYYLVDSYFKEYELKLLMDSVKSSKFITKKKTEELLEKISKLNCIYRGRIVKSDVLIEENSKSTNDKIYENMEKYMVIRTVDAIERSEVVLLVLDAQTGFQEQDKHVAQYCDEYNRPTIIVVNKWDLIEKDDKTTLRFTEDIYDELGFLQFAPILFASALTKQRIHRLADMLKFVSEQQYRRVSTGTLNQLLQDAQTVNPVPSRNGRIPKIYYMTQASVKPPTFILFVNEPELIHFSYMRFLENRLRESFGFEGTPIRLVLRGKKRDDED